MLKFIKIIMSLILYINMNAYAYFLLIPKEELNAKFTCQNLLDSINDFGKGDRFINILYYSRRIDKVSIYQLHVTNDFEFTEVDATSDNGKSPISSGYKITGLSMEKFYSNELDVDEWRKNLHSKFNLNDLVWVNSLLNTLINNGNNKFTFTIKQINNFLTLSERFKSYLNLIKNEYSLSRISRNDELDAIDLYIKKTNDIMTKLNQLKESGSFVLEDENLMTILISIKSLYDNSYIDDTIRPKSKKTTSRSTDTEELNTVIGIESGNKRMEAKNFTYCYQDGSVSVLTTKINPYKNAIGVTEFRLNQLLLLNQSPTPTSFKEKKILPTPSTHIYSDFFLSHKNIKQLKADMITRAESELNDSEKRINKYDVLAFVRNSSITVLKVTGIGLIAIPLLALSLLGAASGSGGGFWILTFY